MREGSSSAMGTVQSAPGARPTSGGSRPRNFERYRDTPLISIAVLLQKHALLLSELSIYTTNLYHNTVPISIAILLQKY